MFGRVSKIFMGPLTAWAAYGGCMSSAGADGLSAPP